MNWVSRRKTRKDQLTALETIGVVVESNADKPKYRYHPLNANLGSMVDQLAVRYSEQRVPILSIILADHSDRTRLFAQAFRIIRKTTEHLKTQEHCMAPGTFGPFEILSGKISIIIRCSH